MRRILAPLIVFGSVGIAVLGLAFAGPGLGISKTAPISGTGSSGDPLKLDVCASGSAYISNGTSWECGSPGQTYTAGTGLSESPTGTFNVNIVGTGGTCPAGTAVNSLTATGTAGCGASIGTGDIEGVTTTAPLSGGCTSGTCALTTSMATSRLLGRITASTGVAEELTGTQATTLLDLFSTSGTTKGLVSGSSSASTACLKGNNTWGPCGGSRATATWSGTVNNYSVTSTTDVIEANLTGDTTLTGLDGCTTLGDTVDIVYTHASSSGYTLTLANLDTNSTLGNRFFHDGGSVTLERGSGVHLRCASVGGSDVTNGNYWIVTEPPASGGTVTAGTNIDVSGSTVSVAPSVSLAGESATTTLSVLGTGTGESADGRKLASIDDTGMTFLGANGTAANSYGLHITKAGSCSDCTTVNSKLHNNIAAYFTATGDETGDNAVNNYALVSDKGGTVLAADPDNSYVLVGGNLSVNSDRAVIADTIASWVSLSGTVPGAGAGFPGGGSYSYGAGGTGNLTVTAQGNGTTGGGTLTLNATGTGAIEIGDDTNDTLALLAKTTAGGFGGTVQTDSTGGTLNDFALNDDTTVLVFSGSSTTLNGLQGGWDGRELWLVTTSNTLSLGSDAGGSTAANRFTLVGSTTWTQLGRSMVAIRYVGASSRWYLARDTAFPSLTVTGALTAQGTFTGGDGDADVQTLRMPKDNGTAPTLSSCGTSPSVIGGSWAFTITVGTGATTACTATFASTKTNTPICIARVNNSTEEVYVSSVSATAITLTAKSGTTDLASDTISVHCIGDA